MIKTITYDSVVATTFSKPLLRGPHVGIELEYEDASAHDVLMHEAPLWRFDHDHSLRGGGLEFISNPLKPKQLDAALIQAKQALRESGGVVNKRCGTHVHINVSDLSFKDVWKVATYYALLEPFIFKAYADGREDSHFCVPMWANTQLQQSFYNDAVDLHRGLPLKPKSEGMSTTTTMLLSMSSNSPNAKCPLKILTNPKYSAMNFTSLPTFGTIEFRQARGMTSMMEVRRWVTFLLSIREEALKYDTAEDIVAEYETSGFFTLCEKVGLAVSTDVNPDDIVDAVDAAIMMVGHKPTDHHTLEWEIK